MARCSCREMDSEWEDGWEDDLTVATTELEMIIVALDKTLETLAILKETVNGPTVTYRSSKVCITKVIDTWNTEFSKDHECTWGQFILGKLHECV